LYNGKRSVEKIKPVCFAAVLILAAFFFLHEHLLGQSFDAGKADFSVSWKSYEIDYKIMSIFVLPNEEIVISIPPKYRNGIIIFNASGGLITPISDYDWKWKAPTTTGMEKLIIRNENSNDSIVLNAFVMVPITKMDGEYLNGYRIGIYPSKPYRGLDNYMPPRGFIEIPNSDFDVNLSPHFRLQQFICKQESSYPKYIILRTALLVKLELILQSVNAAGYQCNTFRILSGYRTPFYNELIGNVKYSRHMWGGAADIFIDENPKDDMMDDLNKDGKINWRDAAIIYEIIDEMYGKSFFMPFVGGLGRYKKTPSHGPFVHIDVRGFRARWGD
jgi:hypothetical protein